jgi:magnesium transporter
MTARVPAVPSNVRVREALETVFRGARDYDAVQYVYLTDPAGRLAGVVSLKNLLRSDPGAPAAEATARRTLIALHPADRREKAATLALEHNLKQVPVVDDEGTFLGAVTEDAILSILHHESREKLLRLSGIHPAHRDVDDVLEIPLMQALKHRLPWLLIGLLGGLVTARFVGLFERTLEKNLVLASFIPLVVYMADAVGTQMEAFVIRDFAVHRRLDYARYFLKQLAIVALSAVVISALLTLGGVLLSRDPALLAVLAISLVLAILSSVLTGLVIPYLFRRMRFDPADASGPIATIVQDFLSVVIYFAVASWILGV